MIIGLSMLLCVVSVSCVGMVSRVIRIVRVTSYVQNGQLGQCVEDPGWQGDQLVAAQVPEE